MRRTFTFVSVAILGAALMVPAASGQVLPKNRAPGAPGAKAAPGPVPAQPAAPAPGETPGQTRREGREQARDARAEARNAGETGPQARETARETRQATRQNIQATHPADMGVWFNNRAANGLVVSDVTNNSALASAGLRAGDQIVSINGQPITTQAQFMQYLTGPNLGTSAIPLIVMRNGAQQTLNLQPTALTQGIVPHDPLYQYGLVLNSQNPNQLVVQQVYPRTPAYYSGIQQGDVITTLNGQPVTNLNAFTQALGQANSAIPLGITRAGQTRNLELEPLASTDSSVRTALRPNFDGASNINAQGGANVAAPGVNVTTPGINATTPGINATAPGANINAPGVNVNTPGASATLPGASVGASSQGSVGTGAGGTQPATQPQAGAGTSPQAGGAPQAGAGATGSAGAGAFGAGASGAGTSAGAKTGAGAAAGGTGAAAGTGAGAGTSGGTGAGTPK